MTGDSREYSVAYIVAAILLSQKLNGNMSPCAGSFAFHHCPCLPQAIRCRSWLVSISSSARVADVEVFSARDTVCYAGIVSEPWCLCSLGRAY